MLSEYLASAQYSVSLTSEVRTAANSTVEALQAGVSIETRTN
jgi:hypothetical protein